MTGTVPSARRRASSTPGPLDAPGAPGTPAGRTTPAVHTIPSAPDASAGASADADHEASAAAPPGDRLAALLAEAGARPAARGQAAAPGHPSTRPAPGHRRQVAARTRVPGTLLLIALAALAGLAWTVLGPGRDTAQVPATAGRPVLAEAELDGAAEHGPDQDPGHDAGHGDPAGADTGAVAGPGTDPPGTPTAPTPSAGSPVYVHVTGEVIRPGVVSVPAGARVVDAVEAAGGLTDAAVTDTVNLAAPVTDGQQVLVPDSDTAADPGTGAPVAAPVPAPPGSLGVPPGTGGPGGAAQDGTVNLNTATAAELETLPRVGPVLAGRIVEFRQQHGGFAAVADLDAVPGIGPTLMEALGPLVSV